MSEHDPAYETIVVLKNPETGVTQVRLNLPESRNAMRPRLHEEMTAALEALRSDSDTRVLVVTGTGESFSAGMDLKRFFLELKDDPQEFDRISRLAMEWRARTLRLYPKPTIAMVNGYCFGGAFSIVEGCDLAFAAEEATFGLSEINFDMFPGGSVSKSLSRLLRPRDALFYGLTGRPFDGVEAARIGLVNAAFPRTRLEAEVLEVAALIASKDPHALQATKLAYHHSGSMDWDAAMHYSDAIQKSLTLAQQDAWRTKGIGQFLAKDYRPGLEGRPTAGQPEEVPAAGRSAVPPRDSRVSERGDV
ncbi:MAG: p-hydroxycinnamoyl CoA hydratase/lyase [Blastococcus sp.]|nr:p-hydroxycinnamoyl CoA hydratase/lyase [Blastococcus sp.]